MSARLVRRTQRLAVAVGVVAVFAMGAAAFAAIPNADGNIYACYSNGDGSLRVQHDPAKPCPRNWSPLKWPATVTTTYARFAQEEITGPALVDARCDEGDVATGGGFGIPSKADVGEPAAILYQSNPVFGSDGVPFAWRVNVQAAADDVRVNSWVVCQHTE